MAADVELARAHLRSAMASLVAASVALGEVVAVVGTDAAPAPPDASTGRVAAREGRRTPPGQRKCGKCGQQSWQRLGSIRGGAEEVVCGFCGTPQGDE
jgi:hypothetical protein